MWHEMANRYLAVNPMYARLVKPYQYVMLLSFMSDIL